MRFRRRGRRAIGVGEAIPDEIPSGQDQGLQAQAVAVAGLPEREFGVAVLGVSGQRPGVAGVGFAERSERADEGLDLAGVGAVSRDACGDEGGQEIALIAAGLADYEAGRVERGGKVEQSAWLVGDRTVWALAASKTTIAVLPTSHPMKRETGVAA